MKVALIGYSLSGRSTLYRAAARGLAKGEVTAVPVPDSRFDEIVAVVKPKKVTPASVVLQDGLDAIQKEGKAFSAKLMDGAKQADALLIVLRAFDQPALGDEAAADPHGELEEIVTELIVADLQIAESRRERLQKQATSRQAGHSDYIERMFMDRIIPHLEGGGLLRKFEMTEEEQKSAKNFQFLTAKPIVIAINASDADLREPSEAVQSTLEDAGKRGFEAFVVCAPIEEEIGLLDESDRAEFLDDLGISEPASNRLIQSVYDAQGLITFYTAGESETRAWPLKKGSSALKAADTIHSDIAKGFIRAEIVHFADWQEAGGWDEAKAAGKMTLEGKEYVIQDGDLLHIRNKS